MAEEEYERTKDAGDFDESMSAADAEADRENYFWARLCRVKGINMDMLVRTEHSATEYKWVIDRAKEGV